MKCNGHWPWIDDIEIKHIPNIVLNGIQSAVQVRLTVKAFNFAWDLFCV